MPLPRRKLPRRVRQPEAALQRQAAQYLDALGVCWCHVPNGGKRSLRTAVELKRQGVKAGVPDILIFSRPPVDPTARGVAIELKTATGRQTPTQRVWHETLVACGWIVRVVRSIDEIVSVMRELGYVR